MNNNPVKSFFYNYDDPSFIMPIDQEKVRPYNRRKDQIITKLKNKARKFQSLDTYDFFSDREEKKKELDKLTSKYAWKMKEDRDLVDFLADKFEMTKAYSIDTDQIKRSIDEIYTEQKPQKLNNVTESKDKS